MWGAKKFFQVAEIELHFLIIHKLLPNCKLKCGHEVHQEIIKIGLYCFYIKVTYDTFSPNYHDNLHPSLLITHVS